MAAVCIQLGGRGYGLVATTNLRAGSEVVVGGEAAAIAVVADELLDARVCARCLCTPCADAVSSGEDDAELTFEAACYCSAECASGDDAHMRRLAGALAARDAVPGSATAHQRLLQCMMALRTNGREEAADGSYEDIESLLPTAWSTLASHDGGASRPMELIANSALVVRASTAAVVHRANLAPLGSHAGALTALSVIQCNAMAIVRSSSSPDTTAKAEAEAIATQTVQKRRSERHGIKIGVGLFPLHARINHSCQPNASLYFSCAPPERPRVHARLLRNIAAGEEITITYIDLFAPRRTRRAELRRRYKFECCCNRCAPEFESEPEPESGPGAALGLLQPASESAQKGAGGKECHAVTSSSSLAGLCAAAAAVDIRIEEEQNVEVAATTSSLTSTMCELSGTLPGVDAAVEGEHVELLQRSIDALGKVDLDSVDAAADDAAADAAAKGGVCGAAAAPPPSPTVGVAQPAPAAYCSARSVAAVAAHVCVALRRIAAASTVLRATHCTLVLARRAVSRVCASQRFCAWTVAAAQLREELDALSLVLPMHHPDLAATTIALARCVAKSASAETLLVLLRPQYAYLNRAAIDARLAALPPRLRGGGLLLLESAVELEQEDRVRASPLLLDERLALLKESAALYFRACKILTVCRGDEHSLTTAAQKIATRALSLLQVLRRRLAQIKAAWE